MSFASISLRGARIPDIPPARKFITLPMCSITLSPAILLPVARDINPPGPDPRVADISPNSVNILVRSVSNPLPAGPATPSATASAFTGGLIGLVTEFPGNTFSATEIAPLDSSCTPDSFAGALEASLTKGAPSKCSFPVGSFRAIVLVVFCSAFLPSAMVVGFVPSSFCCSPLNAPKTHGNCASSPSRKKPMTQAPDCNSPVLPAFLVWGLSHGSKTVAHGRISVGISLVYATFSYAPVYQPRIRIRTRPSWRGSLMSSTSPTHQT